MESSRAEQSAQAAQFPARQLLHKPRTLLRQMTLTSAPSAQQSTEAAQLTSVCTFRCTRRTFRCCTWRWYAHIPDRHAVCTGS